MDSLQSGVGRPKASRVALRGSAAACKAAVLLLADQLYKVSLLIAEPSENPQHTEIYLLNSSVDVSHMAYKALFSILGHSCCLFMLGRCANRRIPA